MTNSRPGLPFVLRTGTGEFVARGLMPPFQDAPAVLLWGDRVFSVISKGSNGEWFYAEAFAVAVGTATHAAGYGVRLGEPE